MPFAVTWTRSPPAIGLACSIDTISKNCHAPTTTSKVTSVTPSAACSAPLVRRGKRVVLCSALVPGNCCPDRLLRPDAWSLCAKSRWISWKKSNNVYVGISSDSVCTLDLSDESMPNSTNCASNGSLSRLPQRGDFCGIAFFHYWQLHPHSRLFLRQTASIFVTLPVPK